MAAPTPHINAKPGDFAPTVLMPGDPLRAKFIAENFLEDPVLVNNVRGVQGYTGKYKGKRVSVMASGMGIPSISIYAHELYTCFDVQSIIRIGTAGMLNQNLRLRDVVIGMSAYTTANLGGQFHFNGHMAPCCSWRLLSDAMAAAGRLGVHAVPGALYSSDFFYDPSGTNKLMQQLGVLAVEMEGAALYLNAAIAGKEALCICTISDNPMNGDSLDAQSRQTSFTQMMQIALEIA